ncbi:MAG: hypothetical protein HY046_14490 [Acidobacteria bacterium]|nr:hypothetical protein [Acidobacteriota bacterium]
MESWLIFWGTVTALAVLIQAGVMVGLFLSVKKTNEKVTKIAEDLQRKTEPVLSRLHMLLEENQPRIGTIVGNAAEITEVAKRQTYKFDRVFSEAVDRLRDQVIRADQILTGALEGLEEAGTEFRRTVWEPVQKATAIIRGIQTGIDFLRSRRRPSTDRPQGASGEEELFI